MTYPITTQKELRNTFWEAHPQFKRRCTQKQNAYPTDIRIAWCDYVDRMNRNAQISDALANRATL